MNRVRASGRGFTLVEVIIVVSLMSIVSLAVSAALILGIRTADDTYTRFDQSNAAMAVNRLLGGDMMVAEGAVLVSNSTDTTCGGVAALKMWSRSAASSSVRDTLVAWRLADGKLTRAVCVGGIQTESKVIASDIAMFTPAACAAPCTSRSISVRFAAKGSGQIEEQTWTLTVSRRGATS
ncbi:MAG: type II secretion system protein [Actinobacteria bacterium]|nr:type II secretion system protein [Actinomycetota bacterium]